jgi:hypothetical protein
MRIAAVLMLLLFGSYFLVMDTGVEPVASGSVAVQPSPAITTQPAGKQSPSALPAQNAVVLPQPQLTAKAGNAKKEERKVTEVRPVYTLKEEAADVIAAVEPKKENPVIEKTDAVQIDVKKILSQPAALNNSVASLPVTSAHTTPLNISDNPEESIVTDGDDKPKRTPAKGFFRKVSRFIERRTGIGTVNADNELWVGAVALKLN